MTAPEIKICGISTAETLESAISARADYCGFVFFPPSPRNLSLPSAEKLATRAENHIRRVGLFVDPDDSLLGEAVAAGRLDAIQLHGQEPPVRAAEIRARFGLPVWKAISVSSSADVDHARKYETAADFLLFDAKTPKGGLPGGMGLSFDWSLVAAYRGGLPWGLAGGLSPKNVADAIMQTKAALVDTSSGVESAPGVKNVDLIRAFCQAARQGGHS